MAKQVKNKKGFKVIKLNILEVLQLWGKNGGLGICDKCLSFNMDGYFIPVLNRYYCRRCYKSWLNRAKYYPEDATFESEVFEQTVKQLKSLNLWKE